MNTNNWKPFFKIDEGYRCMSQQTYEPLVSPDGRTFCKNYDWNNKYQRQSEDRPLYTKDVVNYFFEQELKYLDIFSNKWYAPEVIDVDYNNKKIFLKWYKKTCNEVIYGESYWPEKQWLYQIKEIVKDQVRDGIYKLTMYPHCHYIDNENNMRSIDWYGCVPISNPLIEERFMQGIIHHTAQFRLDETGKSVNGMLNLETMFKRSLSTHVMWGQYNMSYIYDEIFPNG
jgi:hypothetical protein